MAYVIPPYIAAARVEDPVIQYVWDDTRVDEDFHYVSDPIVERATPLTVRAKIALGIGVYEWVAWRFCAVSDDPVPIRIAEAAWCANVDLRYGRYVELDREQWTGPVRGPLWCAITWLLPMIFFGDERPEEMASGLSFLPSLAVHVLPNAAPFESWLDAIVTRLVELYTARPDNPFDDLFGEEREERRGALVAREVLDPEFDYRVELAPSLVGKYLQGIDYRQNPFLRSPQGLISGGFSGIPYTIQQGARSPRQ